ncbi:MAG: hypothetical protein JWQ09_4804, partial [Segetibacter sp.]|nr:hypothetical protein [Segetibacter sp.]
MFQITKKNTAAVDKSENENRSYSFFKPFIQPKLTINEPNDAYEREADSVADQVMRMKDTESINETFFKPALSSVHRKCEQEDTEVHRKENNEEPAVGASTETYINSLSGGRSLNENEKNFFEPRIGYDFSNVKLHTDSAANQSAKDINALAYTHGNNIVFAPGQYEPGTENGKHLLAHELTHVVQQSGLQRKTVQRANPPGWDQLHGYKHPGGATVRITHFTVQGAASDPFSGYVSKARTMLQEHGLGIDVYEAGTINFPRPLQDQDDVKQLRMEAHKKFQDKQNDDKARLPAISAVYSDLKGFEAHNLTGQTISGTEWLPFVLLNTGSKSPDNVTL